MLRRGRGSFVAALLLALANGAQCFSCAPTINAHRSAIACEVRRSPFAFHRRGGAALSFTSLFGSSGASTCEPLTVNGDSTNNTILPSDENLPSSPPLSFQKFVTMQDKRVVVTIAYSGLSGLRPFFLTLAKRIKAQNPDVIIEQRILPPLDQQNGEPVFEVVVDGKLVIGKNQSKKQGVRLSGKGGALGHDNLAGGLSVFVSVEDVGTAITKARKRRRPSTAYSTDEDGSLGSKNSAVRLENLRKSRERPNGDGPWSD